MTVPTVPAITNGICSYCGGRHEFPGNNNIPETCPFCSTCWRFCQHTEQCRWPMKEQKPLIVNTNLAKVADKLAVTNLKEAFESWFVSSNFVNESNDSESAWKEFELFAKEILSLVDSRKKYLQLKWDGGKVKDIILLQADNLYTNQDGEYVVVEGKKRTRIGKDVAVM